MSPPIITPWQLFVAFSKITLSGFGGIMFWARRALVEKLAWLTEREFAEILTIGQVLPGPPGINLAAMVGYRFCGFAGATAALVGILSWPCFVVIGMGVLYQHYGAMPLVQRALTGMAAVAAGLLFATGLKLATVLPRHWRPWLFVALAFIGIAAVRWPLLWVVAVLAPFAVVGAWREEDA